MVSGTNEGGEVSNYIYNGLNALVRNEWIITKNGYGYHSVDAGDETVLYDAPALKNSSTVIKEFVIDYTVETLDPLYESEINGLDYRYVYGFNGLRLSATVKGVENGAGSIIENGNEIRLYYHQDLRGTVDYLTCPVSQKVESWTHYNEWGEITHNAVLKCGVRELDLVKNYTGHEYDQVLDLYYAKARFYDASDRRFLSVDPILDTAKHDISTYTANPMQLVQYLYVVDNPLIFVDPLGLMPRGMLQQISNLYNLGIISAEYATAITLALNARNIFNAFHEIAQLNLAKAIYDFGYLPTLEYQIGRKEADISAGGMIWEVKPISYFGLSSPDAQLADYLISTGQSAGYAINLNGIHIIGNYYMGITTSPVHPGIEYYYFYTLKCKDGQEQEEVSSTTVRNAVQARATVALVAATVIIGATVIEDIITLGAGIIDDAASFIAAMGAAASIMFA